MLRLFGALLVLQLLYTMANLAPKLQNLVHPRVGGGTLVTSRPQGASVYVVQKNRLILTYGGEAISNDRIYVGFTPGPLNLQPADFPARLQLELPGYKRAERLIQSPGQAIDLEPAHWYAPLLYFLRDFPFVPWLALLGFQLFRRQARRRRSQHAQNELLASFERGEPRAGLRLGSYTLESKLGSGGMAEVWRASAPDGHAVAVKMVLARRLDDEARARFRREIRIMMELRHPNIVRLDDWGELAGSPYLVMELIDGPTLSQRLDQGPPSHKEILTWGLQIAEALAAVHELDVVHRDLKPANVMLTERGVKLMDFGVGYLGRQGLTRRGETVGTPGHVAPEQLRGGAPTPRSDLYALGVVLYECVADRPPFVAETVGELLKLQLQGDPPPLEGPAGLTNLIMRLLARDPKERPANAREVAAKLRQLGEYV